MGLSANKMKRIASLSLVNPLRVRGGYPRFLLMTLDAAITAPLRPERRLIEHVQSILNGKSRKFDKVPSTINLVDRIIPGVSKRLSGVLYSSSQLPFNSTHAELINYGTGASVFLLERRGKCKVLKIYRKSLGKPLNGVLEVASEFKRKYEIVCSWYNGDFNLVPRGEFLILNGPILGSPAAAILQPYIHGIKKDLFNDFSDDDLVNLMREDDDLRQQFVFFAEKTINVYSARGLFIDLIGMHNIMLARRGDKWNIVIVDNGVFDLADIEIRMPERFAQIEEYISRIKVLLKRISS